MERKRTLPPPFGKAATNPSEGAVGSGEGRIDLLSAMGLHKTSGQPRQHKRVREASNGENDQRETQLWAYIARKHFKKLMRIDPDEENEFSVRESLLLRSLQSRYARAYSINAALRTLHEGINFESPHTCEVTEISKEEAMKGSVCERNRDEAVVNESGDSGSVLVANGTMRNVENIAKTMEAGHVVKGVVLRQHSFCITDPHFPDNPVIFASPGFLETTGYSRDAVLGRNCRFLQGPGTDQKTVSRLRKAVRTGRECTELMLNYRANGEPFWNQLHIAPIYNGTGSVRYFVGVMCDVTALEDQTLADDLSGSSKMSSGTSNTTRSTGSDDVDSGDSDDVGIECDDD